MAYRRTKQLTSTGMTTTQSKVQPEDDWNLIGNPSVYLDELPQPFKFINTCLQELILNPVS